MNKHWMNGLKAATALLLASALLAACGSKDNADTAAANGQQGEYAQQQGQGQGRQGGFQMAAAPNQPDRQADMMAKIVSVSGTAVVVQEADMSAMPQRGGNGQPPADRQMPQGDGGQPPADGQAPQGDGNGQPPADGQMPQGDGSGQPPADGQAPQGGGGRQMQNLFTGEQKTITIPEGAAIYKLVRDDQGTMNYQQIKLADLVADDIVNIWVKEGTAEAEYVSLRGGFGGGGFGGGGYGQRRGQAQQGDSAGNGNADGQASGQAQ